MVLPSWHSHWESSPNSSVCQRLNAETISAALGHESACRLLLFTPVTISTCITLPETDTHTVIWNVKGWVDLCSALLVCSQCLTLYIAIIFYDKPVTVHGGIQSCNPITTARHIISMPLPPAVLWPWILSLIQTVPMWMHWATLWCHCYLSSATASTFFQVSPNLCRSFSITPFYSSSADVELSWILYRVCGRVFLKFASSLLVLCVDQARTLRCLMPMSQLCGWRSRPAGYAWLCTVGLLLLHWFWEIASSTDATAHRMLQMIAEDGVRCVSYLCTFYFASAVVAVVFSHWTVSPSASWKDCIHFLLILLMDVSALCYCCPHSQIACVHVLQRYTLRTVYLWLVIDNRLITQWCN